MSNCASSDISSFFFFNDTATTEIYTRSLSAASDVYKRQMQYLLRGGTMSPELFFAGDPELGFYGFRPEHFEYHRLVKLYQDLFGACLLYTSDAADERSRVDLGGRRIL